MSANRTKRAAPAREPAGVSRREFLRRGALAGGGLVLACHVPALAQAAAPPATRRGAFAPNAWLRVAPDGEVTVIIARTEMGQGSSTGLAMLVAEELRADWRRIRVEAAIPGPAYGDMSTGGSHSIVSLFDPLRKAGAQAREMLVAAAAARWGTTAGACRAENGEVLGPAGRRLGFGALADAAAKLPVPQDPPLREPAEWRVIGTSPARLDGPAVVAGKAQFASDVRLPGMLHAVIARCPVFGGKRGGPIDVPRVPGVRRVVPIGEGGVAVLADSTWAALRGRDALHVEWDLGARAALDSAAISRRYAELARSPGPVVRREGRGAEALATAARTIEAAYETPFLAHAPMEPLSCTAWVKQGAAEIWVGSQDASGAQETVAKLLGLPARAVTVHLMRCGGAFGRRSHQDFVIEAAEASRAAGVPVQVTWTREDDLQHDRYRPATYHLLRAGFDASGAPLAWHHRMVGPGIIAQFEPRVLERNGVDPSSVDVAGNLPYAFPNLQVESVLHDPGVPVWWWRSVSATQNAYAVECFLDEIAAAAKRDPLELRIDLLRDRPRHRAVLDKAARRAGWGAPLPPGRARGLAVVESFGSFVAEVAEVEVAPGGGVRVGRVVCAVDCGTVVHPGLVTAQIEGAVVYGLSAALHGEITIDRGRVAQSNFGDYRVVTMADCPLIEVELAPSGDPVGGIGEPGVPPLTPAVANAVFAATGKPVRKLPILPV